MSQFILDEQLDLQIVLAPLRQWTTAERLGGRRPDELILDDRIPYILRTLDRPTFITIDRGFWNGRLCHPDYAVVFFALTKEQQGQVPPLLRALVRRSEFRSRASRMGKVVRVSTISIDFWQFSRQDATHIDWRPVTRRRKR